MQWGFVPMLSYHVIVRWLSAVPILTLYSINTHFNASTTNSFENIMGKREIARKEQFPFFPQSFLLNQIIVSPFVHIFEIIYLFAAESEEPKVGISGKGLNGH